MKKLKEWHKNYYYGLLEQWDISSYQASWLSWFKGFIIGLIVVTLCSCGTYKAAPVDKCCETEVVYLDEIEDGTTVFTSYDSAIIRLEFKPLRPNFYFGFNNNYGHWSSRPLWLDFDFYQGNYYSYNSPYYSYFHRPWNFWDYYLRPWTPSNNWYQGPFNNQEYNVVYNSSRRESLIESNRMSIEDRQGIAAIVETSKRNNFYKPVTNDKPVIINKPVVNNNKPIWNNTKPIIRNNNNPVRNNNKPVYNNSRPSYNIKPNTNTKSSSSRKGGKN
tara:strand:- start:1155 stop:1976 length:822 start_codon:yes stop_codon:yes gene_type:complete